MNKDRKMLVRFGKGLLLVAAILVASLMTMPAASCHAAEGKIHIVATTYPVYLFTLAVTKDRPDVSVDLLVPAQTGCPHEYALTPKDMKKLSTANAVVINGLGLEDFMDKVLHGTESPFTVVDSSAAIQPLASGEEEEDADAHEAGHAEHEHHHHHHGGVNPHAFSSPRQAAAMVRSIAQELGKLDAKNAKAYRQSAEEYAVRLESLADRFAALGAKAKNKKVVLLHDAAAYLVRDAGLELAAVIQEEESVQPSAARMLELTNSLKHERPAVLAAEPQYSDKPVRMLAAEVGVPAISLDPVASGPSSAGADYYEKVMLANCKELEKYLGK